jgi:hypothetical protein
VQTLQALLLTDSAFPHQNSYPDSGRRCATKTPSATDHKVGKCSDALCYDALCPCGCEPASITQNSAFPWIVLPAQLADFFGRAHIIAFHSSYQGARPTRQQAPHQTLVCVLCLIFATWQCPNLFVNGTVYNKSSIPGNLYPMHCPLSQGNMGNSQAYTCFLIQRKKA